MLRAAGEMNKSGHYKGSSKLLNKNYKITRLQNFKITRLDEFR